MATFGKRVTPTASLPPDRTGQTEATDAAAAIPPTSPAPDQGGLDQMRDYIAQNRASDPLVHIKVTAQALNNLLYGKLRTERGVHVETMLGILGSIAGFTCLLPVWLRYKAGAIVPDGRTFMTVNTADGRTFYFGQAIDEPLLIAQHSVASVLCGAARRMGADMLPDIVEMVRNVAQTVGSPAFGVPRLPPGHQLNETPQAMLRSVWPWAHACLSPFAQSETEFPLMAALAIQDIMAKASGTVAPDIAVKIALECAIPMAHIDPEKLPGSR